MIELERTTPARAPLIELPTQVPDMLGYQSLLIRQIRRDGGTQARVGLNEDTVGEYTELMRDHIWDFQSRQRPIVLYDGEAFWLADGFHRIEAAQRAGLSDFPVEVLRGNQRDAILRAAGANSQHGLRRTNADKRRAVELLLKDAEWRQWSDRKIADVCAVDHKTVADVRKSLGGEVPHLTTRQGVDGKSYPVAPPKTQTCIRCGKGRDLYRQLTTYSAGIVPEYDGKEVTLCSACIPELMRIRADQQAAAAAPLPSEDEQHAETIRAILKEAADKGERTGTRLYQQAYDHAREIHDVTLYNKMIALIDRATDVPEDEPPPPPTPRAASATVAAYDAQVRADEAILMDVTRLLDQARQMISMVKVTQKHAADLESEVIHEQARAFSLTWHDKLTRFSEAAMISQKTFNQAIDHIDALLSA